MIRLYFIRHGATEGNLQHRYIGRSDEPLCTQGKQQIAQLRAFEIKPDRIFVSPMKRCLESAELLFPELGPTVVSDFRETDFGLFEGKTADELGENPEYKKWLDSMCMAPIPGGEAVEDFKKRCCAAFEKIIAEIRDGEAAAFLIHGGVIMAILEKFAVPHREFYDYHLQNGECMVCDYEAGNIKCSGTER